MKGGITSGVVYPPAICELAKKYQFKSIGGASAGAIAAAAAAAAEKGRSRGGFEELAKVSEEVAARLLSLFQPAPALKPLFDGLLATLPKQPAWQRALGVAGAVLFGYAPWALLGALPASVLVWLGLHFDAGWGLWVAVPLLLGSGVLCAVLARVSWAVLRDLPKNFFGVCSGMTEPGHPPALSVWLSDLFDRLAAHGDPEDPRRRPLTFGDLIGDDEAKPEIDLQIMTTCLAHVRPYRLPFRENVFMWRVADFRRLFCERVVNHMIDTSKPVDATGAIRWLPRTKDFPVVVAVRMSLSFPILLSAVPLYARDFTLLDEQARKEPRLTWFSDGGICSNFPIHFFDSVWPSRPTFGIDLDRYSEAHHEGHVFLPQHANEGILKTPRGEMGLFGFLGAIIDSMQEWRDVVQTSLPGYRERIASVRLTEQEGGINLAMPRELVLQLGDYGRQAGELLREFSFDRHRWRRHLVWMAEFERILARGRDVWTTAPPAGETLQAFLIRYSAHADEYAQSSEWRETSAQDLDDWMKLASMWLSRPSLRVKTIPRPAVETRLTPRV
jgi:predicted acylesterase/phospholipase RssA